MKLRVVKRPCYFVELVDENGITIDSEYCEYDDKTADFMGEFMKRNYEPMSREDLLESMKNDLELYGDDVHVLAWFEDGKLLRYFDKCDNDKIPLVNVNLYELYRIVENSK